MATTTQHRPQPRLAGVRHTTVIASGIEVHVAEAGDPDAEPIVLLHGWPQHWYCFRKLIPILAPDMRVICPDMRGFGWSEAPPSGYEKEQLADDVVGVLDALELDSVHLAGHDWGGIVGFLVALENPDRVRTYTALNTAHLWPAGGSLRNAWRVLPYQSLISAPVVGRHFVRRAMVPLVATAMRRAGVWGETASASFTGQFDDPDRAAASVAVYRSFLTREAPQWIAGRYRDRQLHTPTLVIHGTADPVLRPTLFDGLEDHITDLRVELVPGVSHFIAEEAPETVARLLAAHVAR